jgi:hypothetical protein
MNSVGILDIRPKGRAAIMPIKPNINERQSLCGILKLQTNEINAKKPNPNQNNK